MELTVWTIGHSTRSAEEFRALLAEHAIEAVADVRRFPGSRRVPQFGGGALAKDLRAHGVDYRWLPELGGRRRPAPDSPNTGWRSDAFRGYADYMMTGSFAAGLDELVNLACGLRTAIMCAEAVWWRCHRGLISDALRRLGFEVCHIMGPHVSVPHPYTAAARIVGGRLSYAAPAGVSPPPARTASARAPSRRAPVPRGAASRDPAAAAARVAPGPLRPKR
jgi:uncharacterized protein (DUF488 family)